MRKILLMVGIFLNSFAFCQVAENFSDGEVLHHPQWVKDTGRFIVNTNKQLQSKTFHRSDTAFMATPNSYLLNTSWEFYVQINTDPSTSNQLRVYLAFDKSNLDSSGNGYFIQIGETGSQDSYDLFRKNGKSITKIIDGPPKIRTKPDTLRVWFYVIHRTDGYWELYSRTNPQNSWDSEGNCFDRTYRSSSFFGLSVKHTSTRADKFMIDDILIYPYEIDTFPPEYNDIEIQDSTITLLFSEEIDTLGIYQTSKYKLNNIHTPKRIYKDAINTSLMHVVFNHRIVGGRLQLRVPALADMLGNKNDSSYLIQYNYIAPITNKRNDVIISEIMADPSPAIDLPESEYIEWYNASGADINLENWVFANGNSNIKLKAYTLNSNSFVIFCKASDTSLFKPFGNVIGLSTWPSVGNTSGLLKIIDKYGTLIDEVNYNTTWYKNKSKANGGYSLECTQANKTCEGIYVWEASAEKSGGSPGQLNSLWKPNQQSSFYVYQFDFLNDTSVYIRFNASADSTISLKFQSYQLNNPTLHPKRIVKLNDYYSEYILTFNTKFRNNNSYQFKMNSIKTCDGKNLDETIFSFVFRNDDDTSLIRINELMIDPSPSIALAEAEYIELFNTSNNYINLSSYVLNIGTTRLIMPTYLLKPNEYILVGSTTDTVELKKYGTVLSFNTFPSLSNTASTVTLFNKSGRLIDRVSFKNSWYRDLTKSDGGWSLELIDPYTRCNEINRWTASTNKRGGSPAIQNASADFYADKRNLSVKFFRNSSNKQFSIGFSKPVQGYLINPAQLYLVGAKSKLFFPQVVKLDSPYYERAILTFNTALPAGNYNLVCQYIPSCGRNDTNILYPIRILEIEQPEEEIAVSEIMADPSPSRGLPDCEYLELFNKTLNDILYTSFYIADTKDTVFVEVENWKANEAIIICHKNYRYSWSDSVRVIALNKLPSLGNEEDTISLLSFDKTIIDRVIYNVNSMPKEKQEGGYSFIKINNTWNCNSKHAWQTSKNKLGGSPGRPNESIAEYDFPSIHIENYVFISDDEIELNINELLDSTVDVLVTNEFGEAINYKINELGKLLVKNQTALKEGEAQRIHIRILNCLGMQLDTILTLHKKHIPQKSELLISEVLFNPEPNGFDFIEIYNTSDKIINLEDVSLSNGKEKYSIKELITGNNPYKYIRPKEYRVFTLNTENILNWYLVPKQEHLLESKKMPSMPDDAGVISILNEEELLIDEFVYDESLHYSWLENVEGRSLERKRLQHVENSTQNWASASDNIGRASPTGTNSQFAEENEISKKDFWLSNNLLKPYAEGSKTALEINYNIEGETVFMNVKVFSVSGAFISEVMHGLSIRNSGMVKWDLANNGSLVPAGTYVLSIECYSENGKNQQYKLPFAVHY